MKRTDTDPILTLAYKIKVLTDQVYNISSLTYLVFNAFVKNVYKPRLLTNLTLKPVRNVFLNTPCTINEKRNENRKKVPLTSHPTKTIHL